MDKIVVILNWNILIRQVRRLSKKFPLQSITPFYYRLKIFGVLLVLMILLVLVWFSIFRCYQLWKEIRRNKTRQKDKILKMKLQSAHSKAYRVISIEKSFDREWRECTYFLRYRTNISKDKARTSAENGWYTQWEGERTQKPIISSLRPNIFSPKFMKRLSYAYQS